MAIIDVVSWDAAPGVLAWKYPSRELSSWTQLIVSESQEAVMLKEGKMVGPFTAGRHVLSSDNYPVLNSLLKIPFGRSPYTAEVWFVQRAFKLDVRWGTSTPILVEDPEYHIILPVRAFGQYGITVENTAVFLGKLVGTLPAFTVKTLTDYFRGVIVSHVKDLIAKYIVEKNISILKITANLLEIGNFLEDKIAPCLAEFGLKMTNFTMQSISTDDEDPAVKKLKSAMAARAEMDIMGFNYQQKRSFDTMEIAAGNPGHGSGMMEAGIGMGMGFGMGGVMGGMANQMAQNLTVNGTPCPKCRQMNPANVHFCNSCGCSMAGGEEKANTITCDKCGTVSPANSKFCPQCGDIFRLCPYCGADNPAEAVTCRVCGRSLPAPCPKCGREVSGDNKFCPACGARLGLVCPKCSAELPAGTAFCSSCGEKLTEK